MPRIYDLDEIDRKRSARQTRPAVLTGSLPGGEPEELSLVGQAGDILAAPIRGIEGAVQDVYGLADTLAFDALPDYEDRLFGVSRTRAGGLIEGVSNFAAGFVGASFVPLSFVGKLGRLAPIARGAIKGAIADFAVFDGHEERLSNLVQAFPALQNPITEFLAADEKDSELEGRFKNVLEGMGIGAFTEVGILAFKGARAARKGRAAGKTPEEIEVLVDRAAPPQAVDAAMAKAGNYLPPEPELGTLGSPTRPEAADSAIPPNSGEIGNSAERAPKPSAEDNSVDILRTMDVDPVRARELLAMARARKMEGLRPDVNPRNLSEAELFAQGMQSSDLNMSRYVGPEGAMQLLRSMEQMLEPLKGIGDASRRTLNQQEESGLRELADMVGEGNPHRLMISLQKDVSDLTGLNRRVLAYKTAMASYSDHAARLADKAFSGTDEADLVKALDAISTLSDLELGVKSLLGEQGRGLGANRIPVRFTTDLFDKDIVEAALHERGGRGRAKDLVEKFRILHRSTDDVVSRTAKSVDMAKGLAGRRAMGILNEYWYNSLLGRPTTAVVNSLSNALTSVYRPLELIAGGALTGHGEIVGDGVRELTALVHSAGESWRATAAALRGDGQILDPKSLLSDINNPRHRAISPENLGVDPGTVHGQALKWVGRLIRFPSTVLHTTDQFFQQLNYRAVARAQLTKEAMGRGVPKDQLAGVVTAEIDKLIYRGQAYGSAQQYRRGVEQAVRSGLTSKTAVDEFARDFAAKAMASPEGARLSALAEIAQRRAQEATFTAPLTPGTVSYRYQEMVLNHWYLRMVTPFVRTPVNIIGFAADRSVRGAYGVAQVLAGRKFPSIAANLEQSKNIMVRDILSGDPRRRADAAGRFALGMSTTALILTKAAETDGDGLPMVTGRGPSDKEQRKLLEDAGWQPYSVRIGNKYVAYGRLDPFASILGTAADVINYVKYAAPEDQGVVEDLVYGSSIALVNNLVNKTYMSGLANFVDMLHDPQRSFQPWSRTLAASFVPGQLAAGVSVDDPILRDVRSILDAAWARTPGLSDNLPALRNVLGEPVRRAQSLGNDISSVSNAFVPILYREVSDDVVNKEFAKLKHGFTPPKRTRGGLDLTTVVSKSGRNAYDRWLELHGSVEIGGRDLRETLRRTIASSAYKKIPVESTDDVQSPRIGILQGVIEDYRAAALRQLTREFPEVGQADRARVRQKAALVRGQETRPPLLQALQPR